MKQNINYNKKILEIMSKYKWHVKKILNHPENKYLLDYINSQYDFPENTSLPTKLFWLFNNVKEIPRCKNPACNKILDINRIDYKNKKYCDYCCSKCATSSPLRTEKIKQTNLKRYGTTSPAKNEQVKQKTKNTCLKKYGTTCSFANAQVKEKIKQTNLKKYGVEYAMQAEEVKQKNVETCLKRYGVKNGGCSAKALEKIKNTNQLKYGVDSSFQRKEIQEKSRQTMRLRYGVDYYLSTDESKKYYRESATKHSYYDFILKDQYDEPCFSYEEYKSRSNKYQPLNFKCKKCGTIFKSIHINGSHLHCPVCYPIQAGESREESEIFNFISNLKILDIQHNIRRIISPLELDIYIPSKKIAIEFDGLYWHSSNIDKPQYYHLNKTELCANQGIQLIHIFENEWIVKQNIVKSRLKNLLGIYDKTVFARKCEVKEIDSNASKAFQEDNHIQGAVNASINFGLYYDNELISLMTFGKNRFSKKYEWEMLRFCNKLGYHIPGAAGKLLKHFEKTYNPKSLVSYADRRWSQGKLYKALGFTLDHISAPNYWYWKNNKLLESRIKYQKHKLKNILDKYDESLSEFENMKNNGYHRIYDCGNLVFVKEYNESK